MLNTNHPDDERLSALASRDDDAVADAALTAHVSSCDRCTGLVTDLGALRMSLGELPDLAPSRPLRLLPEVPETAPSGVERLGGWVRRLFAPAITAGAALAMVGLVGTASPGLDGATGGGAEDAGIFSGAGDAAEPGAEQAPAAEPDAQTDPLSAGGEDTSRQERTAGGSEDHGTVTGGQDAQDGTPGGLPAERSPWPMLLFTGIAVMVGAGLLRWILVPRAG